MGTVPARDRLAVWTYDDASEEIACGDPFVTDAESVTDAERAAAGESRRMPDMLGGAAGPHGASRMPHGSR